MVPPGAHDFVLDTSCSSQCTSKMLPHPIHVFKSMHHMHLAGTAQQTTIHRNGSIVGTSKVEFYDHGFQTFKDDHLTINPGDRIQTQCWYTNGQSKAIAMGPSTADEMCMHAMLYYPRVPNMMLCGVGTNEDRTVLGEWCGRPGEAHFVPKADVCAIGETPTVRTWGTCGVVWRRLHGSELPFGIVVGVLFLCGVLWCVIRRHRHNDYELL